jgi:hypothetical protein
VSRTLRTSLAIAAGRATGWLSRVSGRGQGATISGRVMNAIAPDLQPSGSRGDHPSPHLRPLRLDYPKKHPKLGLLSSSPDAIAQAICEKDDSRLQPSGAYAVNFLGLSQQ